MKAIVFLFSIVLLHSHRDLSTVYIMVYEDCPVCVYMSKSLIEIHEKHNKDFRFKLVFSNRLSNYKTIHKFKKKYGLDKFEVILDADQSIAKRLGASVTPEAIVVNDRDQILYKGRISNAYFAPGKLRKSGIVNELSNVLDAIVAGGKFEAPWPKAVGCYITFEKQ